jgi:hypothetical protein
MRDLHNRLNFKQAFYTANADNTASAGSVDRLGYGALELLLTTGALVDADATFALTMKESDTGAFGGEETDVAVADLLGTLALASFIFSDDNKCFKIGYRGNKRYVKAIVTPANNTGAANIAGVWILGDPTDAPTPNPPV